MKIRKDGYKIAILIVAIVANLLTSCNEDFTTIGANIIGEPNFATAKATYNVSAATKKLKAVRTDALSLYQLGRYTHPFYGETEAQIAGQMSLSQVNPSFGAYSQEVENNAGSDDNILTIPENETVTRVLLSIPFF